MNMAVVKNSMVNAHLGKCAFQTTNARISAVLTATPRTTGSLMGNLSPMGAPVLTVPGKGGVEGKGYKSILSYLALRAVGRQHT